MEKFAVDLDKVLDDFELDEDENASYQKLQLKFTGLYDNSTKQNIPHSNQENNWLANVSEVIYGERSSPDGQHDDSVVTYDSINDNYVATSERSSTCPLNQKSILQETITVNTELDNTLISEIPSKITNNSTIGDSISEAKYSMNTDQFVSCSTIGGSISEAKHSMNTDQFVSCSTIGSISEEKHLMNTDQFVSCSTIGGSIPEAEHLMNTDQFISCKTENINYSNDEDAYKVNTDLSYVNQKQIIHEPIQIDEKSIITSKDYIENVSDYEYELKSKRPVCHVASIENDERESNDTYNITNNQVGFNPSFNVSDKELLDELDKVEQLEKDLPVELKDESYTNDSSISTFSQIAEFESTNLVNIPYINTIEVGTYSSSLVREQKINERAEEGSSGSSGTETTSSSSTLIGDLDQSEDNAYATNHDEESQSLDKEFDESPLSDGLRLDQNEASGLAGVGSLAPIWVPDKDSPVCQECEIKFTLIRRRHHCRACGRVLCSMCCHLKAALPYLDFKEERVCDTCFTLLTQVSNIKEESQLSKRGPNPNNPMEYCSRIPPPQQVAASGFSPPPTVMVPVGILKRDHGGEESSARGRGNKQVIFMDGIQPGGDLSERIGVPNKNDRSSVIQSEGRGESDSSASIRYRISNNSSIDKCMIPPGGGLPPVLLSSPYDSEYKLDYESDKKKFEKHLTDDGPPLVFAILKNLTIVAKKVNLDCCIGLEVWNLASRGLCTVGQEELVLLLQVVPGETTPPPQLFNFFHHVYQLASKGNLVTELGYTIFSDPEGFLGSKDNTGFLYIRPSFQCLNKLLLPPAPYLFPVLIQKWESPWAKAFPLRLMLRLGAEYRYYPCPLVSIRKRKSVFCEIGHTIMNLLVDFRNYAYTVPSIQGFTIHMEDDKKTTLYFPRNRYEQVCRAIDNSNDNILAFAANFSPNADSHLVTVEDEDGNYSTQAINIQNKPRKVTGASFVVFNGALKLSSGLKAKSSIVEDGLMVQITGDMMDALRDSLRSLKDFNIACGLSSSTEADDIVSILWTSDDVNFNVGIKSAIDNRRMDGVPSIKIHTSADYANKHYIIRWTELFIIQEENSMGHNDTNINRLSENLSRSCCLALLPHLHELFITGQLKVALRATIHQENVGYEIGSGGNRLPSSFMNNLDKELIPVIHQSAVSVVDQPIILELIFHVLEQ